VVAAINLVGPTFRLSGDGLGSMRRSVTDAARRLSTTIGGH
jgi:DNA-binding IclR family transcriptional regulator